MPSFSLVNQRQLPKQKQFASWRLLVAITILISCVDQVLPFQQPFVASAWVGPSFTNGHRSFRITQFRARVVPSQRRTQLLAKKASSNEGNRNNRYLEFLLQRHGYDRRIVTLSSSQLPLLAEMYDHGQWELCLVTGFQQPSAAKTSKTTTTTPPLVEVQLVSKENESRVVDLGQITTIWKDISPPNHQSLATWRTEMEQELDKFPVQHADAAMQRLYQRHNTGRTQTSPPSSALTKKQISKLVSQSPGNDDDEMRSHVDSVLRKVVKAGPGMSRLVDSSLAMEFMYNDYPKSALDQIRRKTLGANVLAQDAKLGGRFKRMSCIFVSAQYDDDSEQQPTKVTLINGGWLALDQSVRAGTEARKFAQRTEKAESKNKNVSSTPKHNQVQLLTAADERIAQRLECLAMGEVFSWGSSNGGSNQEQEEQERILELDVREALKAMDLPTTPDGAQVALLRIGRWSQKPDQVRLEPWTQECLEAARWYSEMNQQRLQDLYEKCTIASGNDDAKSNVEQRVDLTALPCVCVDAKGTSFRDDAIGVRPRSSTGRKVVKEASKWEILVHIADVSDVYLPKPCDNNKEERLHLLRDAAARRGMSRYDLPLGPLHLMPPVVLKALSLETNNVDMTSKTHQDAGSPKNVNRCVTLWAYIDERYGKVIDAGLERTMISTPIALSFADASALLDGNLADPNIFQERNHILNKARAILSVAERNLLLWSTHRRKSSEAARKRESRLSARELVGKETQGYNKRDGGRYGFQRTRGHKLVDASLDLYGFAISNFLRRAKAPIPRASGSGAARAGRVATAPLRRYIDGMAQRQALSVVCGYGGRPLTEEECAEANKVADKANNAMSNIRSVKQSLGAPTPNQGRQRNALRLLQADLAGKNRPVPAVSTGRENEVAIMGVGAVAMCRGVKGSLKPGDRVMVKVRKLDAEKGILSVSLVP